MERRFKLLDFIFIKQFSTSVSCPSKHTQPWNIKQEEIEHFLKKIRNFVVQIGMDGRALALLCSPSNIQKLLKTHPPLNNPLWVASDITMCNMSGFNSYPGTPLTPSGETEMCHLLLVLCPVTSDDFCDHRVMSQDRAPGASCSVDLCLFSPGPVIGELCNKTITTSSTPAWPIHIDHSPADTRSEQSNYKPRTRKLVKIIGAT